MRGRTLYSIVLILSSAACKIPSNFVQISGPPIPITGLFFAAGISSKSKFITRDDVPNPSVIPPVSIGWNQSCLTLFPHSTTIKPAFWD